MTDHKQTKENSERLDSQKPSSGWMSKSFAPFRKALTRGLAIVLPPLLTLVLFLWAWNTIDSYVLGPVESLTRTIVVWSIQEIHEDADIQAQIKSQASKSNEPVVKKDGDFEIFATSEHGALVKIHKTWIPKDVFDLVASNPGETQPTTAIAYYDRYVQLRYLQRRYVIPAFLSLFILVLYLLGRLMAAGMGRIFWRSCEAIIERLPLIRNVYSAVKQVTDFAFSENEIQFTRIVAVEYPRKGIWSMGFVTGESMIDIKTAANEAVVSVLMPTSPMPATGFTITVPKSETVDLNITVDQAIQFCVSCGVVVPPAQQAKNLVQGDIKNRIESMVESAADDGHDSNVLEAQKDES